MIVYDVHTAAFIREAPVVTLDSYNQEMKRNTDGSVDIYFGPQAPAGKETNWIYTAPGKTFFPAMRFYDPDKPLFDKTWKLPDIEQTENFTSTPSATPHEMFGQEAYEIVKDAYVYAYPLLLSDLTLRQQTNFAEPTGKLAQAPLNQFSHATGFTPPDWKVVVRPNVDTLYSPATLDLGPEPVVLSVPATDRYFVLPMMSLWTDMFAVPGTRTTGRNTAQDFLLVGPNWRGDAPAGLEIIRSPTRIMNIGGRTQTNGVADYENVHKIQEGYKLTPLSAWGKGK
jgi:hypothetical protein